jgi:hypothetical protein
MYATQRKPEQYIFTKKKTWKKTDEILVERIFKRYREKNTNSGYNYIKSSKPLHIAVNIYPVILASLIDASNI